MLGKFENAVPTKKIAYKADSGAISFPTGYVGWCIVPDSDSVFSAATDASQSDASKTVWLANTHPAGVPQWGLFSALTVTSGTGNIYITQ